LFKGYGAKVGLGNMRVKAENRMVTGEICRTLYKIDELPIGLMFEFNL
jgi:hypothetical protein